MLPAGQENTTWLQKSCNTWRNAHLLPPSHAAEEADCYPQNMGSAGTALCWKQSYCLKQRQISFLCYHKGRIKLPVAGGRTTTILQTGEDKEVIMAVLVEYLLLGSFLIWHRLNFLAWLCLVSAFGIATRYMHMCLHSDTHFHPHQSVRV